MYLQAAIKPNPFFRNGVYIIAGRCVQKYTCPGTVSGASPAELASAILKAKGIENGMAQAKPYVKRNDKGDGL